jgi:integrase
MAALDDTSAPPRGKPATTTSPRKRLTDRGVERLRPPAAGRLQIPDAVTPGLWLRVTPNGAKSWSVLYRLPERAVSQRLTLGKWPAISCTDARRLAAAALVKVAQGEDPAAAKRERRHANGDAFEVVADAWLARKVRGRIKTAGEVESIISNKLLPAWRGRRIGSITRADVHRILDAEIDAGRHRTANKLLGHLKRLFAWAIERDYLSAEKDPTLRIKAPGEEQSRDRELNDAELRLVWLAAGRLRWPWCPITRLLILTAQRRTEVGGLAWAEIDLERAEWNLPAERSKSARAHLVPLSDPALAILRSLPRIAGKGAPLVFRARTGKPVSGYSKAKEALDRELARLAAEEGVAPPAPWRLHDLRRTAISGMARLGVQPHVLAAVANHAPAGVQGVTAIYNRHKYAAETRQALALWASNVAAVVEGRAGNVVALVQPS